MVKHHVKKNKADSKAKASLKKKEEKERLEELENLDRFAGSSGEEDGSDEEDGGDGTHEMDRSDDRESSDSEESGKSEDDYDDVYKENVKGGESGNKKNHPVKQTKKPVAPDADSEGSDEEDGDSENDYKDGEESDDDDDEEAPGPRDAKSAGMANAMSRILGGQSMMMFQQPPSSDANAASKATKPVVLSKTTTPLQRLQKKIQTEEQALRQKRHNRRSENLTAMRLPLAPTAGMSQEKLWKQKAKSKRKRNNKDGSTEEEDFMNANALAIANEIEGERAHRRIATRGVVALFNAISKHRSAVAAEAVAKEDEKRRIREEGRSSLKKKNDEDGVSTKTKHGFLDMIKKSAVAGGSGAKGNGLDASAEANGANDSQANAAGKGAKSSSGWSALKDDFMMNSKLKDWDKEISDDSDNDDAAVSRKKGVEIEAVKERINAKKNRGKPAKRQKA